jgi:hypothetical protein
MGFIFAAISLYVNVSGKGSKFNDEVDDDILK